MATAKQLAARKLFAARAKAGTLKKGTRKKNPTPIGKSSARKNYKGKYPRRVYSVSADNTGRALVTLNNGEMHTIHASETGGKLPALNADFSKYEKNPIARTNISKTAYVKRPSQTTGKAPTKRLTARRKTVASGKAPKGYFPNPTGKLYTVHTADKQGNPRHHIAHFRKLADAKQYAQAYADLHKTQVAITSKSL